ncbi:hypothetical protein Salat_1217700 [Sesamum alatum]|uniref:Uncharacterized protein n=1 Tax=Sesamum alatum TaxID=300844 RepID=A0AAE1YF77_9LAMI|nr:hypothetical protein Salat_1217700 [Sesamum alatum]
MCFEFVSRWWPLQDTCRPLFFLHAGRCSYWCCSPELSAGRIGCFPAFTGRFLSELQAFLTGVQCCCLCSVLLRFQQPVAGFLAAGRTGGDLLHLVWGLFWVRLGSVFRRRCNIFPTGVQLLLAQLFSWFWLVPLDDFFVVLGDQLLHLKRNSRFAWFGFDFQKVFSLSGKLSVCDIAPHFYRCLVGLERILLPCSPSPHQSLACSCAQLFFKVPVAADGRFSWCWVNKDQPTARRDELQVCTVFSAFSGQFSWLLEEACFILEVPSFSPESSCCCHARFCQATCWTNRFNRWSRFYLLLPAEFLGIS